MKYIPWKNVILYGIVWIIFPTGVVRALITDHGSEPWTFGGALTTVLTLVAATGIYFWVIATQTEGKRLANKTCNCKLTEKQYKDKTP